MSNEFTFQAIRGRMAEWSKAVDSSIVEYFGVLTEFPTYPGFESQFYHTFWLVPNSLLIFYWILIQIVSTCVATCGEDTCLVKSVLS